ncbi:hypothetical protein [Enterococcus sp. N249-2]
MKAIVKKSCNTYRRPSRNAETLRQLKKDEQLEVYPLVEGWLELRPQTDEGTLYTEFVEKTNIKFV